MKKRLAILFIVMAMVFTACNSKSTDRGTEAPPSVVQPDTSPISVPTSENKNTDKKGTDNKEVDIDLTTMSSTMVYSEVYNIMTNPDDYIGKTIKMTGEYYNYLSADETVAFPACVIADATACCQQGIEFVLEKGDYPEEGTTVTVTGVFKPYIDETDGYTYYHLENSIFS